MQEVYWRCSQDQHSSEEGRTGQREVGLGCLTTKASDSPIGCSGAGMALQTWSLLARGGQAFMFLHRAVFGLPQEEEVTLRKVVLFRDKRKSPGDSAESHQPSTLPAAGENQKGKSEAVHIHMEQTTGHIQPCRGALGGIPQYPQHLSRSPLLVAEQEHKCRSSDSKPNKVSPVFPALSQAPLSQGAQPRPQAPAGDY